MTTTKYPGITVHHHAEHGLTHIVPSDGGHDYWVRHADGAIGIHSGVGDNITWGYLVGSGELEIIESIGYDPILVDAVDREAADQDVSPRPLPDIFGDRRAS